MKLSKFLISLSAVAFFYSCEVDKEYFKHDLDFEKIGECKDINSKVNIIANTIGERYELQECLDATYDGQYSAQRKGDTVFVNFTATTGGSTALYKIILDINTRPGYSYLSINGSTMQVNVKR